MIKFEVNGYKYKVRWQHFVDSKKTVCELHVGDVVVQTVEAKCRPRTSWQSGDTWNRHIGRKIAFTRVIATLPREIRQIAWEKYWLAFPMKAQ